MALRKIKQKLNTYIFPEELERKEFKGREREREKKNAETDLSI